MIDFRRWLRLGSPQLIVVAAAVVGSASGCHSLSEYLIDAGSVSSHRASSDWPAAQPLSAPYEAFPPQVPGGQSIPLSPTPSLIPSSPVLPAPSSAEADLVPPPNESVETEVATQTGTKVDSGVSKRAPQPELPMPDGLPQSVVVTTPESSDPADAPGSAITESAITESAEPKGTVAAPTRADEPFGANLFPDDGPLTDLTAASPLEARPSLTKPEGVTADSVTADSLKPDSLKPDSTANGASVGNTAGSVSSKPGNQDADPPFAGPSEVAIPEPVGTPVEAVRAPLIPSEAGNDLKQDTESPTKPANAPSAQELPVDNESSASATGDAVDERGFVTIKPDVVLPEGVAFDEGTSKPLTSTPDDPTRTLPIVIPEPLGAPDRSKQQPLVAELSPENAVEIGSKGGALGAIGGDAKREKAVESDRELASIANPEIPRTDVSLKPGKEPTTQPAATTGTTPITTTPVVLATVDQAAEAVVYDQDGNAFVSHNDSISRVTPDGQVEVWAISGAPRGHVILPDGTHAVCDARSRSVVRLSVRGEAIGTLATRSDGDFLRAPSDLALDTSGGIYFTDPGYARIRNPIGRIHYVAPNGMVNIVAMELGFPKGVAVSPDGATLYVVESQTHSVLAFPILSGGRVMPKRLLCELPPGAKDDSFANGLTVDSRGRLFVAAGTSGLVHVIDSEGKLLKSIETGLHDARHVSFADGTAGKLFVAGRTNESTGAIVQVDIGGL